MAEAIRVHGVSVSYGSHCVVENVSFESAASGLTAILGPNGAGKTSLLKAVAGLLPYAGGIALGRRNIADLSAAERARALAYVPQKSLLSSPLSVREVVAQGRYCHRSGIHRPARHDESAVTEALRMTDAEALAQRPFTHLSGGEQRRVLLARALATESRTILLDEPTISLDLAHSLALFTTLARLARRGFSVLLVLHDLRDTERFCQRVVVLQQGKLVADGPPQEVISEQMVGDVYGVRLIRGGGHGYERLV